MKYTRRDLPKLLSALAAVPAATGAEEKMLEVKTFDYNSLQVKVNPQTQNESRGVLEGFTHNGFHVGMHMTKLAPGQMPHAPHHHSHEEILMLHRGTVEAMYGDGKKVRLTAPSSLWMASNVEHVWKNVGNEPAEYFVVELGKGQP